MGFKKFLASAGIGGAKVDTVLHDPNCTPGGVLHGVVNLTGGKADQRVQRINLALVARVEVEYHTSEGDQERLQNMEFHEQQVAQEFELAAGREHQLPFSMEVPGRHRSQRLAVSP